MENSKELDTFANAPVKKAVLSNAIPAMVAMLMVLIYNLADTFFIGLTRDDMQVAVVSLATPVFLLFMSVGTIFGIGGTSAISRALGEGKKNMLKSFFILYVELCCCRYYHVCIVSYFYGSDYWNNWSKC